MQPYKKLFTYWFSIFIYDFTVEFCKKWIVSWKLKEQMEGAARSGKQNIVEGSEAMQVSIKSGIKLTGVAKASFEELIGDYEDFLRQRKLMQWEKNDARIIKWRAQYARFVKDLSNLGNLSNLRGQLVLPIDPKEAANLLLTLCHQETYLLYRQVESLKDKHMKEGGLTEELYRKRIKYRKNPK